MNSFISWIGGKKLLRKHIISQFPEGFDRYIEVFGGAGWILFGKEKGRELEVFNDIDGELINLYRCVKYHCKALQEELEYSLSSREIFYNDRERIKAKGTTDIQRAAAYFRLIRTSFGSDKKGLVGIGLLSSTATERARKNNRFFFYALFYFACQIFLICASSNSTA